MLHTVLVLRRHMCSMHTADHRQFKLPDPSSADSYAPLQRELVCGVLSNQMLVACRILYCRQSGQDRCGTFYYRYSALLPMLELSANHSANQRVFCLLFMEFSLFCVFFWVLRGLM